LGRVEILRTRNLLCQKLAENCSFKSRTFYCTYVVAAVFCAVVWCGSRSLAFWRLSTRPRRKTFVNSIRRSGTYRKTFDQRKRVRCDELWRNTSAASGPQRSWRNDALSRCANLPLKRRDVTLYVLWINLSDVQHLRTVRVDQHRYNRVCFCLCLSVCMPIIGMDGTRPLTVLARLRYWN